MKVIKQMSSTKCCECGKNSIHSFKIVFGNTDEKTICYPCLCKLGNIILDVYNGESSYTK